MGTTHSSFGRARGTDNAQLVTAVMNVLGNQKWGGLEGLVDHFVGNGLGDVINSWISPLENLPVSEAQVRRVLGKDVLAEIAWQARISQREASNQIAILLPQLVDRLTPKGRIPPGQNVLGEMSLLAQREKRRLAR